MARIIKVYLLSHVLTVISLAEDWGAYPFEDFIIIDFNHERETWTLKDGGARSLKSFSVLPTPKVLETKFGKRITISRLGYDSSLNEFILSLESDGKKFDLSLKEADLHLNQESTQRLNEYLVQIDDTKQFGGKRHTGILMEISPDFSQLALATGSRQFEANAIRHEIRPNLPPLMIPYKRKIVLRKVIHRKIAQISPDSQKLLKKIQEKRFKPLFEIAAKITSKKIEHYTEKEKFDPIDAAREKERREREETNFAIAESNRRKIEEESFKLQYTNMLEQWQREYDRNRADRALLNTQINNLNRQMSNNSYQWSRMRFANERDFAAGLVAHNARASGFYADISALRFRVQNIRDPKRPSRGRTLSAASPNFYKPRIPWKVFAAEEMAKLNSINEILKKWDAFIAKQPAGNLITPADSGWR